MSVGYMYRTSPQRFEKFASLPGLPFLSVFLFIGFIVIAKLLFASQDAFTQILLAIVTLPFFALVISHTTVLAKVLGSRALVFLGTVSYSLYLIHMTVFETIVSFTGQPQSGLLTVLYICFVFIIASIISSILYFLLERPYFMRKKVTGLEIKAVTYAWYKKAEYVGLTIAFTYIAIIFIVFQSSLTFFSLQDTYSGSIITTPKEKGESISLQDTPIQMRFTATNDNLGAVVMKLHHESIPSKKFSPQEIVFQIQQAGGAGWYAQSRYQILHPSDPLPPSFGFPLVTHAKGKTYIARLSLKNTASSEFVTADTKNIKIVYLVDRHNLRKIPQLVGFIENKLLTVISDTDAQLLLLCGMPFFLFFYVVPFLRVRKI